ncbi:hypothetical protein ORI89_13950 [Sphingobacterium sp. UT-1RO-CII-1]|uniref:hypothetical protein n=1 Tax=Sphingobacterium sp. UT-1RO-CII-1 TaxID=2995225 RepID=UPI00227B19EE|nr:hypothetical protein [Sphingobacterium sp. UT-1RO-CII-1]MCY4780757.1 hypothetical protein [Sphingobacterium sp. UT-1RO-CII-1]
MKKLYYLITLMLLLSSCQQLEQGNVDIEGEWYVRTDYQEIYREHALVNTSYRGYARADLLKKHIKLSFTRDGQLLIRNFDHKSVQTQIAYNYKKEGEKILLSSSEGRNIVVDHSFVGLSSKSLKVIASVDILKPYGDQAENIRQVIMLLRELPIADPEEESTGQQPDFGVPIEPQS